MSEFEYVEDFIVNLQLLLEKYTNQNIDFNPVNLIEKVGCLNSGVQAVIFKQLDDQLLLEEGISQKLYKNSFRRRLLYGVYKDEIINVIFSNLMDRVPAKMIVQILLEQLYEFQLLDSSNDGNHYYFVQQQLLSIIQQMLDGQQYQQSIQLNQFTELLEEFNDWREKSASADYQSTIIEDEFDDQCDKYTKFLFKSEEFQSVSQIPSFQRGIPSKPQNFNIPSLSSAFAFSDINK